MLDMKKIGVDMLCVLAKTFIVWHVLCRVLFVCSIQRESTQRESLCGGTMAILNTAISPLISQRSILSIRDCLCLLCETSYQAFRCLKYCDYTYCTHLDSMLRYHALCIQRALHPFNSALLQGKNAPLSFTLQVLANEAPLVCCAAGQGCVSARFRQCGFRLCTHSSAAT